MTLTRLCIKDCGRVATRPVRKQTHWRRSYCQPCWQALPCNQRAQCQRTNPNRLMQNRASNPRRIHIGRHYMGRVKTAEQAQRIRAHIKGRLDAFKRQQSGAQAEATDADPVSIQARTGAD